MLKNLKGMSTHQFSDLTVTADFPCGLFGAGSLDIGVTGPQGLPTVKGKSVGS